MQPIADALGVSVEEAALGVIRLANANMINALKLVSVRRGYDPRDFALIAFGGGGAMHAAALAKELHVGKRPDPAGAGPLLGLGHADDRSRCRTSSAPRSAGNADSNAGVWKRSSPRWTHGARAASSRVPVTTPGRSSSSASLDMRYHGQEHTVRVPVTGGRIDVAGANERFHAAP